MGALGDDSGGDEVEISGNRGKVVALVVLSLISFVSVGLNVKHYVASNDGNVRLMTAMRKNRASYTPLITSSYNASWSSAFSIVSNAGHDDATNGSQNGEQRMDRKSLPIYLLRPSENLAARTTWGDLAERWNRTTQYEDLFSRGTIIPSLPSPWSVSTTRSSSSPQQQLRRRRPVVMIHCGPKTGSTTLRKACRYNLAKTCNIDPRGSRNRFPAGYKDETVLYPLIRNCTDTSHFCATRIAMPGNVPAFGDVVFVHVFPFRNYDEWAKSALKQQYDRGKDKGCDGTRSSLEKCKPSSMELDFRKYGKTDLSRFKEEVIRRMESDRNEQHVLLLYHHRELHEVMNRLSDAYGIPLLPGTDGRGKLRRPNGTCDDELLRMFHDCFSSELMELT